MTAPQPAPMWQGDGQHADWPEAQQDAGGARWSVRRRIAFIAAASLLCWLAIGGCAWAAHKAIGAAFAVSLDAATAPPEDTPVAP